VLASGYAY